MDEGNRRSRVLGAEERCIVIDAKLSWFVLRLVGCILGSVITLSASRGWGSRATVEVQKRRQWER